MENTVETKGKSAILLTTKVVVRLLPATLKLSEFLVRVEQEGFILETDFSVIYYVQGNLFALPGSRCYLKMSTTEKMTEFITVFSKISFDNSSEPVVVTISPYQEEALIVKLPRMNTISVDKSYQNFLENEVSIYTDADSSVDVQNRQLKPVEFSDSSDDQSDKVDTISMFLSDVRKKMNVDKEGSTVETSKSASSRAHKSKRVVMSKAERKEARRNSRSQLAKNVEKSKENKENEKNHDDAGKGNLDGDVTNCVDVILADTHLSKENTAEAISTKADADKENKAARRSVRIAAKLGRAVTPCPAKSLPNLASSQTFPLLVAKSKSSVVSQSATPSQTPPVKSKSSVVSQSATPSQTPATKSKSSVVSQPTTPSQTLATKSKSSVVSQPTTPSQTPAVHPILIEAKLPRGMLMIPTRIIPTSATASQGSAILTEEKKTVPVNIVLENREVVANDTEHVHSHKSKEFGSESGEKVAAKSSKCVKPKPIRVSESVSRLIPTIERSDNHNI